jgi:hypothetical protein
VNEKTGGHFPGFITRTEKMIPVGIHPAFFLVGFVFCQALALRHPLMYIFRTSRHILSKYQKCRTRKTNATLQNFLNLFLTSIRPPTTKIYMQYVVMPTLPGIYRSIVQLFK